MDKELEMLPQTKENQAKNCKKVAPGKGRLSRASTVDVANYRKEIKHTGMISKKNV